MSLSASNGHDTAACRFLQGVAPGARKSSALGYARGALETPETRHYYSGKGVQRDAEGEAARVLREDHRGGPEDAKRAEDQAGGRLGRAGHRRRERPLRGGRPQAAQGREEAEGQGGEAKEEAQKQKGPGMTPGLVSFLW
jgi:hypothetical protein